MPTYTTNLALIKPLEGEQARISQINSNMDTLDTEFSAIRALLDLIMPIGFVGHFAKNSPPAGGKWLTCSGGAVSRTTYASLFAICGTTYGSGDGSTTFNIPNLYGRSIVGYNSGDTGDYQMGVAKGSKMTTLPSSALPNHSHSMGHTHTMTHTHSIAHDHPAFTNGLKVSTTILKWNGSAYPSGGTTGVGGIRSSGDEVITIDIPSYTGQSGASSATNTGGSSNASTGASGSGAAFDARDPYLTLFPMIRAL